MKIGSTYEYTRSPWTVRPGKVIPASIVRFTVTGFDQRTRSYSVTYEGGGKHAISQGSPMHRGSTEVLT